MIALRIRLLLIWLLCSLAALFSLLRMLWCIGTNTDRAWDLAISLDQLANRAANGRPNETISSRAYRAALERRRWGCILCGLLDLIQTDHCKKSAGT